MLCFLLGSWRGQLGNRNALIISRLAPLCLVWCLWREWNTMSIEDHENGLLNMKKMMLQSLYIWRVAWNSFPISNFSDFFFFFLISNLISLKSANGRNPSTEEVYKSAYNQRKQKSMNLKTLQT